jgi:hypothetical protein
MFVVSFSKSPFSCSHSALLGNTVVTPTTRICHRRVVRALRSQKRCRMQQQPSGQGTEPAESVVETPGTERREASGENGLPEAFQVDMPVPARSRRTGATVDADGKGNVWAIEPRVYTETSGESATKKYLALAIAGFIGLAILILRFLPLTNADQM